jgi:hypothetical protein
MLYQLPTGKTIEISVEEFLSLTDEDFQNIIASDYGMELNQPFFNSSLEKPFKEIIEIHDAELPDIDIIDKLNDQDIIIEEE